MHRLGEDQCELNRICHVNIEPIEKFSQRSVYIL